MTRDVDTAHCPTCDTTKPVNEFSRSSKPRGVHGQCRACDTLRRQLWREEHRERERAYERARKRTVDPARRLPPDGRRRVPVRLTDVPLDRRLVAAERCCRQEPDRGERERLIFAALYPSDDVYWIAA